MRNVAYVKLGIADALSPGMCNQIRRNLDRLNAALALYELTECPVMKIRLGIIIAKLA